MYIYELLTQAIPKVPIDDHKTYTVKLQKTNKSKDYHSLIYLLHLQRNPYLHPNVLPP